MKSATRRVLVICLVSCLALAGALTVWAQSGREAYTALAKWKNPRGQEKTARLTIVIERYTTDEERDQLAAALKAGGTTALQQAMEKMPATGYVEINEGSRSAAYFTRARDLAGGKLITILTGRPLGFIGGADPKAKPKAGYEVGYVSLEVMPGRKGQGDAAPAAKIKMNEDGALVVEDYGGGQVWLSEVQPLTAR